MPAHKGLRPVRLTRVDPQSTCTLSIRLRVSKILPLQPELANSSSHGSKLEIPPTPIRQ
jgi:hypothetical protein